MATKPATLEWLDKHIFSKLSRLGVDPATLSQVRAEAELLPKILPAGSLEVDDSLLIFGLTYDPSYKAWSLEHHERYEIPPLLTSIMDEFAFVMRGSVFNEALARSKINIIMTLCIGEEKRLALNQVSAYTTLSAQSSSRPTTPTLNVAPIALQFETRLSSLVTFKKEKRMLQGVADYTLCYDADEQMGTNLVLMESKRKGALSLAEGQLVAYMGMVHRTREAQQKRNKVVYGLSTDGNQFQFWRLDNSSELTHSRVYGWDGGDSAKIVSYIRFIVRAALHSSPSTFPIKGAAEREVSLQAFSDPDKARSFDYEIGRLGLAGEDGVGGDMEIV